MVERKRLNVTSSAPAIVRRPPPAKQIVNTTETANMSKRQGRPARGHYPEDFVKEMCLEVYAGAGWDKGDWERRLEKVGQDRVRYDAEYQYRTLVIRFLDAMHRVKTDQRFFTELFGDLPERT